MIKFDSNQSDNVTKENWHNTFRFALGTEYKYNDKLTLRTGVAYDQTPIPDSERTPRTPGGDRTWLSIGANYAMSKNIDFDIAYTHLFIDDPEVNLTDATNGILIGDYKIDKPSKDIPIRRKTEPKISDRDSENGAI